MRLLNTETIRLEECPDEEAVAGQYALLSHTWAKDEVKYEDTVNADAKIFGREVWVNKIMQTCIVASQHNLKYAWVDTCMRDQLDECLLAGDFTVY